MNSTFLEQEVFHSIYAYNDAKIFFDVIKQIKRQWYKEFRALYMC